MFLFEYLQASFFGFGPTADIEIDFNNQESHPKALVKRDASSPAEQLLLFTGKEAIEGTVRVILKPGVRLDHTGIKIELFGQIGTSFVLANSWFLHCTFSLFSSRRAGL
jgi:vacuolar protein sorting-associated protein 26